MDGPDGEDTTEARSAKNGIGKGRTRVSRACDRCRLKKDKCDGQKPSCSTCITLGEICTYDPSTRKRGLPEGYVRGLEKLWALSMNKIDGLEDLVSDLVSEEPLVLQLWNHDIAGEELHSSWKDSKILHDLEYMLTRLEASASDQGQKRKRDKDDSTNNDDGRIVFHTEVSHKIIDLGVESQSSSVSTTQLAQQMQANAQTQQTSARPEHLPADASILLEFYFSFTHCWLPIVERHEILRTLYSFSTLASDHLSSGSKAVLWALLAYSEAQYASIAAERVDTRVAEFTSEQMAMMARTIITANTQLSYDIGHVQALLVLALYDIGIGSWESAWLCTGQAVRISQNIALAKSLSRRKVHVLLSGFLLDTIIASRLGHVPHLRSDFVKDIGHVDEDGLEEWDPWLNALQETHCVGAGRSPAFVLSIFNRLVDVFVILNDVLCYNKDSTLADLNTFWQAKQLPLRLLRDDFPTRSAELRCIPPHHAYIHLMYISVMVRLMVQSKWTPSTAENMAALCCEYLELLSQISNTQGMGLRIIAPILEHSMRIIHESAFVAVGGFGKDGRPSQEAFSHQMDRHAVSLIRYWPVFGLLDSATERKYRSAHLRSEHGLQNNNSIQSSNARLESIAPTHRPQYGNEFSTHGLAIDTTSMNMITPQVVSRPSLPSHRQETFQITNQPPFIPPAMPARSLSFMQSSTPTAMTISGDPNLDAFDILFPGTPAQQPQQPRTPHTVTSLPSAITIPMSIASPISSFHGDDVDAIFYNLAHLDTTDWMHNRQQGLKDFGFSDDSTFLEFCNDPERLITTDVPIDQNDTISAAWPPPGFFPGQFESSPLHDPHVEASQILQNLSNNDGYAQMGTF